MSTSSNIKTQNASPENWNPIQKTLSVNNAVKTLASDPNTKALGGTGEDPALSAWYEEAFAYYNSVMNGTEARPDNATWDEFLRQMQWAYQQLMTPAWEPQALGAGFGEAGYGSEASDPFGGMLGTDNNLVHTAESTRVGFLPNNETRDIWSNEVNLDVAPLSAHVSVVRTQDERQEPFEDVLKIIVDDSATGTQSVYMIHDYEDASITINVPDPGQVEDLTESDEPLFTVGEFQEGQSAPQAAQSNLPGTPHPEKDHYTIYEPRFGQELEFYPEGSGVSGEVEYHEVYGDSSLFAKPSDHISVVEGIHENDFDQDMGYTIAVTHLDGSQDVYYIQPGYDVAIGAKPEYLSWNGGEEGAETAVPEEFTNRFTLLGVPETLSDGTLNPAFAEDTPPDSLSEDGTEAFFNLQSEVVLHTNYDSEVTTYHISTPGTVEIHANNYEDIISTVKPVGENYMNVTVENPEGQKVVYQIEGDPEIHILGALPQNVYQGYKDGENAINYHDLELVDMWGHHMKVFVENGTQPDPEGKKAALDKLDAQEEKAEDNTLDWPRGLVNNVGVYGNGVNATNTILLIEHIEDAMDSGNWDTVTAFVNSQNLSDDAFCAIMRKLTTALFEKMGNRNSTERVLKDHLPKRILNAMIDRMGANDPTEQGDHDHWHNAGTKDVLQGAVNRLN